ncbi:hypothetical protein BDI24065_01730 [Burkholderia diffusa]|uniref:Uncharacterized protein n=1 Tax=Burkholderia diffusa TaxID=488732 RepID=A0A6P2J908_9BURK|nr:hypothetical protein BDI24065_01730 [Burkholderia diffusa]
MPKRRLIGTRGRSRLSTPGTSLGFPNLWSSYRDGEHKSLSVLCTHGKRLYRRVAMMRGVHNRDLTKKRPGFEPGQTKVARGKAPTILSRSAICRVYHPSVWTIDAALPVLKLSQQIYTFSCHTHIFLTHFIVKFG